MCPRPYVRRERILLKVFLYHLELIRIDMSNRVEAVYGERLSAQRSSNSSDHQRHSLLRPVCRTTPANRYQNVAPFWILLQQRVGDGGDDDNGNSITLLWPKRQTHHHHQHMLLIIPQTAFGRFSFKWPIFETQVRPGLLQVRQQRIFVACWCDKFLQAGYRSCRPTNSVMTLKASPVRPILRPMSAVWKKKSPTDRQSSWSRAGRAGPRRRAPRPVWALAGGVDCGRTDDGPRARWAASSGAPWTACSETKPTHTHTVSFKSNHQSTFVKRHKSRANRSLTISVYIIEQKLCLATK